jgi:glycosyltransferase involved in cell wall biosynthesis
MQALEVSVHLQLRGYPVWLACLPSSRLRSEADSRGIPVLPFNATGYLHPLVIVQLARFLRREKIRVIHCQLSHDLSTVVPAADLSRTLPVIVLSKRMGSFLTKRDPFHRYTYSRVNRVLAISEIIHRNVLETTPVAPGRVLTLHDAVDMAAFSHDPELRKATRQEFGYNDNNVVVGFVGRFSRGKGHEEFLHAAEEIMRSRPNTRFLIVGEASAGEEHYEREIKLLCTTLGLGDAVAFAGYRRDIRNILSAIDLFAFPSHAESFGVSLIEAMAAGLASVASSSDGVLDIVTDGETGLLVPPKNPRELAVALMRLMDDPSLRDQLGRAARERVMEKFERAAQLDRLESIYDEVLQEKIEGGQKTDI